MKGLRAVCDIPTESLGAPWRLTPSKTKLNNCVLWKTLWTLSQLWRLFWLPKAASWKPRATHSCFDSACTISGEIRSHWSELPASQCPHLPNGDEKSMLNITRVKWGLKELVVEGGFQDLPVLCPSEALILLLPSVLGFIEYSVLPNPSFSPSPRCFCLIIMRKMRRRN